LGVITAKYLLTGNFKWVDGSMVCGRRYFKMGGINENNH
jgi:hypothetical protein